MTLRVLKGKYFIGSRSSRSRDNYGRIHPYLVVRHVNALDYYVPQKV